MSFQVQFWLTCMAINNFSKPLKHFKDNLRPMCWHTIHNAVYLFYFFFHFNRLSEVTKAVEKLGLGTNFKDINQCVLEHVWFFKQISLIFCMLSR